MLSIKTFGSLEVSVRGENLELPTSRKTRALLAYLVLSSNPHRRDRLCELFWEMPDDPRGALRWSLSKLRPILNAGGHIRLLADRERVQVDATAMEIDFHDLRACALDDDAPVDVLMRAWEQASQMLIGDCELPNLADFTAWLEYQRNETRQLRARLAERLALSADLPVEETEKWAMRWLSDAPCDPRAAQQAVAARRKLGHETDALALATQLDFAFREAGLEPPDFTRPIVAVNVRSASLFAEEVAERAWPKQAVRLVHTADLTALACAFVGTSGHPPLVKTGGWLTHLELDWDAPVWSPIFLDLARAFRFVRYDERGCGLSDWDAPEVSFEASVSDLESVVDAAGFERFPLLGISEGAAVAIEYAARHPRRVSHLVLFGGQAAGWRHTATAEEIRAHEAALLLTRAGWGRSDLVYRRFVSQSFIPDASVEELRWLDEFQKRATSGRNALRYLESSSRIDVRKRLKQIEVPTLVVHSRGDLRVPVAAARELAACIPNSQFLILNSNNHLLLGRERAARDFIQAVRAFLAGA